MVLPSPYPVRALTLQRALAALLHHPPPARCTSSYLLIQRAVVYGRSAKKKKKKKPPRQPPLIDSTKNEHRRVSAMLESPFKSRPLGPSEPPQRDSNSASCRRHTGPLVTHRGRPHFANPGLLGDGSDLIDESIRIFEFFPAGLEDRALRRRLELVRPRLAHGFGATRGDSLGQGAAPPVGEQRWTKKVV